ncbi:ParB/RepB/Spo0J family partition protein [Conexibacter sp. JD483]|uniref:ParB/RepB/Spo0J family partition protein n=1 Tax=unclassified Conexibacter TaxID=2627773 RepID=UPI00271F3678|nr:MULTISPECIES: ParB/RepB/Spo0J family partition protein [unclassified Conexibacter]MDO8184437.1 ParB/RepB/Spo0J family partition protein [Conexibacter sp. CPCC 205706]MDO8197743.1 ParB/RepB/Spo0J family partition protein [Conexibacter sp. CPCC 205762]MDR9368121.1 ParB/RepB/Spo0J family partition protein [Conexibacter sp. JD483]
MAEKPRGMGRGLSAILSAAPRDESEELRTLPVEQIAPNPHQPRRQFEEEALVALAESLKARGLLQPILVRPLTAGGWELIAGERRWRAAKIAGIAEIPAIVRQRDDAASLELAVIENMAREDLNPVEEARACAALVEELSLTREDVGRRVGRSRVAVSNLIRLLDLPDDALALLERGDLSEGHGRALLLAPDHGDRRRLARDAAALGWSVRELERRARAAAEADEATAPRARARRSGLHPDQQEAVAQLSDVFSSAVGSDVEVAPAGAGYRVQLSFETLDEALALARRLGVRAVA